MNISEDGLAFIRDAEGFRGHTYKDVAGYATIGYGNLKYATAGRRCTREEAEQWLLEDLAPKVLTLNKYYGSCGLNQNMFDALCSLTFNVGAALVTRNGDPLSNAIHAREWDRAAQAFTHYAKYRKAPGEPLQEHPGLMARRKKEAALFLRPIVPKVETSDGR